MNKLKTITLGLAMAGMFSSAAYADNSASAYTGQNAKVFATSSAATQTVASQIDQITVDGVTYYKVLSTELKNAGTPKDLVMGLSFETALFTDTSVKTSKTKVTSEDEAEIKMLVIVDRDISIPEYVDDVSFAAPGIVTYDRRKQILSALLGSALDCTDSKGAVDENGLDIPDGEITFDECLLVDQEIELILDTTAAHSFNFLAYDIGSGSHTIEAFATVDLGNGVANANQKAVLGKGTLSVLEVQAGSDPVTTE